MEVSKKKLLSLIKENITEMSMDFDTEDRPDKGIQDKLKSGNTPLGKIPFPKTGQEPNKNFQELLASERYKEIVQNIRRYTGINEPMKGQSGSFARLVPMMMSAHHEVMELENTHKEALEELAVKLVKELMGLEENQVIFDAKIVGMQEIDTNDFNREQNFAQSTNPNEVNIDDSEMEEEEQLVQDLQNLNLQRAKKRFILAIIQGASKIGQYAYQLVPAELRRITGSDRLLNLYGVLMSINDAAYWQLSDDTISNMGNSVAGKVKVQDTPQMGEDGDEDGEGEGEDGGVTHTIVARGINFPVLVHELVKGVLSVISKWGNPEDEEIHSMVQQQEETLEKEMWDLRLGPALWKRMRSQFPDEILTDENKIKIQLFLLKEIFVLDARKMLILLKEVVSLSENGKRLLQDMVDMIESDLNEQDYEAAMEEFNNQLEDLSDETNDDELDDFLGSLGIHRSDDDE